MWRTAWRISRRVLLGLLVLVVAAITSGLAYRSYRQHQNAELMAIHTPAGIDEGRFVEIDGSQQWIRLRGRDRANPVILFLHGGPGGANAPFEDLFVPFEKDYTIVDWDQPGAGRTFGKAGGTIDPALTIDRVAQDGIEVAELVRRYLQKEKIILVGMSWGTVVGIHMAKARPELFYCYVGTGQLVATPGNEAVAYARVLGKARARNDSEAMNELEKAGPPPYRTSAAFQTQRKWALEYEMGAPTLPTILGRALVTPGYSLRDSRNFVAGLLASLKHFAGDTMDGPLMSHDLRALGTDFAVPIFVFQGAEDDITPAELAKSYVASIQAPQVEFIAIEAAGHDVLWTHSDIFLRHLNTTVRPLTLSR